MPSTPPGPDLVIVGSPTAPTPAASPVTETFLSSKSSLSPFSSSVSLTLPNDHDDGRHDELSSSRRRSSLPLQATALASSPLDPPPQTTLTARPLSPTNSNLQLAANPPPFPTILLDLTALSTPGPSVLLDLPGSDYYTPNPITDLASPSQSQTPTPPLPVARVQRRSSRRLPSFLARLSAAAGGAAKAVSPTRSLRKSSRASLHPRSPASEAFSDTAGHPRDIPADLESRSGNVQSRTSCSHPLLLPHNASTLSLLPSTLNRRTIDAHTFDPSYKFPRHIFTSTAACRLSVPIDALERLDTVSDQEIKSKMHQTSSRLLRMTEDERPYTRDFKDLFSTLMVSLPLTPHRVRFQKVEHTFTSDEAITNLGSLKFSQSNRMPDPKDPSRIVTTTTTTTFSMAKEMAKSVCQKFLEARFIESVDSRNDFSSKSAVWQLTPKGMHILHRFCNRNGINQRHVQTVLESPRNTMHLVLLEREADGDKIHRDQATIEVVFRRFVGQEGPNLKWSTASSDSDSLTDYQTGLVGVKMARERKIGDKTYWNTFTGKAAVDWLMDCCTMVDRRETIEVAGLFCESGLIAPVEKTAQGNNFSPAKSAIYTVTEEGQRVAGWIPPAAKVVIQGNSNGVALPRRAEGSRDSNANKMTVIIRDPALRLLYREFLRDTHCEENLAFYLDVKEFLAAYNSAKKSSPTLRLDTIRETLAAAYSLYNAFLAPGSPCELNIDHTLRIALAGRMTRAVGDDEATISSLDEVANLFDQAQSSVFKLMASDSVPKFMREPKYASVLRERNLDMAVAPPTRSSG